MPLAAGIDVGGTKMLGVVIDTDDPGTPLRTMRAPSPRGTPELVRGLAAMLDDLGVDHETPVGLGIPGLVDRGGIVRTGPNLPDVLDAPIGRLVEQATGRHDIRLDNDATCGALAELRCGAARGSVVGVFVSLGTGIGAGLWSDGHIVHGAHGFAGEPGHMIVDPAGPRCPCGRNGCWERYGSGSGLAALGRSAASDGRFAAAHRLANGSLDALRGEDIVAAARGGDSEAEAVLDRFAWWVALGCANIVAILDPDVIVLGGGVIESADVVLDRVRAHLPERTMGSDRRPPVRVEGAAMGERAGAIGAALLGVGLD